MSASVRLTVDLSRCIYGTVSIYPWIGGVHEALRHCQCASRVCPSYVTWGRILFSSSWCSHSHLRTCLFCVGPGCSRGCPLNVVRFLLTTVFLNLICSGRPGSITPASAHPVEVSHGMAWHVNPAIASTQSAHHYRVNSTTMYPMYQQRPKAKPEGRQMIMVVHIIITTARAGPQGREGAWGGTQLPEWILALQ